MSTAILQVLKSKERPLVSSIFFMCLPDKVCRPDKLTAALSIATKVLTLFQ